MAKLADGILVLQLPRITLSSIPSKCRTLREEQAPTLYRPSYERRFLPWCPARAFAHNLEAALQRPLGPRPQPDEYRYEKVEIRPLESVEFWVFIDLPRPLLPFLRKASLRGHRRRSSLQLQVPLPTLLIARAGI